MVTENVVISHNINLEKFIYEDALVLKENKIDKQIIVVVVAWKRVDFLCKN